MKPPKSVRSAFRTFLGVEKKDKRPKPERDVPSNYRSSLEKSRKNFGSVEHLNRGRLQDRRLSVTSFQSQLQHRSSSMPPSTKQRIEEWNSSVPDQFDDFDRLSVQSDPRRSISAASAKLSGRTQSLPRMSNMRPSHSIPNIDRLAKTGNLDWNVKPSDFSSFRDSGAFDLYINEDAVKRSFEQLHNYSDEKVRSNSFPFNQRTVSSNGSINSSNRHPSSIPRSVSFSTLRPDERQSLRTTSHVSSASERLLSCMSALDKLGEKLERAARNNSDVEKRQNTTDRNQSQVTPQKSSRKLPPVEWQMGGEKMKFKDSEMPRRERRRSTESSSTDSGITSSCDWGTSNQENPPSRPRSSCKPRRRSQIHDTITHAKSDWNQDFANPADPQIRGTFASRPTDPRHFRSDSLSSGYSSGSAGAKYSRSRGQRYPAIQPHYAEVTQQYPEEPHYMYDRDTAVQLHPFENAGPHYNGYDYGNQYPSHIPSGYPTGYESEDPYGYASYTYPPSSLFEEELQQRNGWFYLPSGQQQPHHFPTDTHHAQPYPTSYDFSYPYTATTCEQAYPSRRYGTLQDSFLDPTAPASPLAAAISQTCAASSRPDSYRTDVKKYGSFRYRDGEKTVVTPSVDSRRRKTVRFSQTVNQRVETSESEMEDSTSLIKGCSGEENCGLPSAWKARNETEMPSGDRQATDARAALSQPIYEFPAGHIENSCMCSDCILARQSCQLQTPASYAYY